MRRRLLTLAALLILVVVGRVAIALQGHDPATVSVTSSGQVPQSPAVPTSPPPGTGSPSPSVAESGPHEDMDPVTAAEAWVTAWLDTSGGKAEWLARLKPITAPQLYAGLIQTDIARVPQGKVQPGTQVQPVEGQADVAARVPTTAGAVLVAMTVQDERLVVTANDWAPDPSGTA